MQIKLGYRTPTGSIVPFGYAVANEVCRPWAVFQSHFCYGWETVALYSSGILRHLLSWRWGSLGGRHLLPIPIYLDFTARVVWGFPGGPPGGSFTSLNEKTKNENFLPELAVAFYDGLINKLLSRPARPW